MRLQTWILAVLTSLGLVQAWIRGDEGRVQWDYECSFEGHDLVNISSEPSSRCGQLCLANASCSHWSWSSADGGTCCLKQGATNGVVPHSIRLCGFLPPRFALDESKAFDFGLHLTEDGEYDGMADNEAETALQLLNSFRSNRGKPKLTLDPRLILVAHEMAAACLDVPLTSPMENDSRYEFLQLPGAHTPRGFTGQAWVLSVASPLGSSVKHAIEWWTSAVDPKTDVKPVFSDDVGIVGFAKRTMKLCTEEDREGSDDAVIVWTLLLAPTD